LSFKKEKKLMKIVVLSDTHIPKMAQGLPKAVYEDLKDADMVFHAGDIVEKSVLDELRKYAPVKAVCGNMDSSELRAALPGKLVVKVGKFKVGLIHGYGTSSNIVKVVKSNFDEDIDAIVFGHSHSVMNEVIGHTLFFNPGTPTDKLFTAYNSYGVLDVGDRIIGRIIKI